MVDKSSILKIENVWNKYNKEHMEQEKCSKLLLNSKISNWAIVSLLQIEEFKSEILKYEKISDEEIIKIVYILKHQFAMASDNNALDSYKLSIIDSCIENICQANVNNLNSI